MLTIQVTAKKELVLKYSSPLVIHSSTIFILQDILMEVVCLKYSNNKVKCVLTSTFVY